MKKYIWLLILLVGCSVPTPEIIKEAEKRDESFKEAYDKCCTLYDQEKYEEIIQIGNDLSKRYNFFQQYQGSFMFYLIGASYDKIFRKNNNAMYAHLAIANYKSWIKSNKNEFGDKEFKGNSHYFIGRIYYKLNKEAYEKEIIYHAKKSIEANKVSSSYRLLNFVYYNKTNYNKALEYADKAIEADPNLAWNHLAKAETLRKLERFVDAKISLDKAEILKPDDEKIKEERKKIKEAEDKFRGDELHLEIEQAFKKAIAEAEEIHICPKCKKEYKFQYVIPINTMYSYEVKFRCPNCGHKRYAIWKEEDR